MQSRLTAKRGISRKPGSQSEEGERFVERVMTVAMTLKLRAQNTFEYFTDCFKAFIKGGRSPPIPSN